MPCAGARKVGSLARQINASIKSGEYKPSLTLQNHAPEDVVAMFFFVSSVEKLLGEKNAMGGSSSDSSKTVNKNTSQQPVKGFPRYGGRGRRCPQPLVSLDTGAAHDQRRDSVTIACGRKRGEEPSELRRVEWREGVGV